MTKTHCQPVISCEYLTTVKTSFSIYWLYMYGRLCVYVCVCVMSISVCVVVVSARELAEEKRSTPLAESPAGG